MIVGYACEYKGFVSGWKDCYYSPKGRFYNKKAEVKKSRPIESPIAIIVSSVFCYNHLMMSVSTSAMTLTGQRILSRHHKDEAC